MRYAGALRIDHVMGLYRLYWIPPEASAAEGAYVHYAFDDLLSILALESQRNECMVIGEDLGTVPDEVRAGLSGARVMSYRVLYFERDEQEHFKKPDEYPVDALVAASDARPRDAEGILGRLRSRAAAEAQSLSIEEIRESRSSIARRSARASRWRSSTQSCCRNRLPRTRSHQR